MPERHRPGLALVDADAPKRGPTPIRLILASKRGTQVARAEQAQQELRERRWAEAAEYRARLNKDKPKLTDVQPASDAEVVGMAVRFLQKMAELEPDPNKRSWYRLFRHMDDDGSGRINFHELVDMVRTELYLKPKEMPEATLKSLWAALDKDGSGYVAAGEFGTFMRKGEAELRMLHPPTTWKKRLESARRQEAAAVTSALNKEKNAMLGVVAASEKDVDNLSLQLNQKLLKLFPKNPAWYKLFRHSTRRARILDLEGLRSHECAQSALFSGRRRVGEDHVRRTAGHGA